MTKVHRVYFFQELPQVDRVRLLSELRRPFADANESRILAYLAKGVPVGMSLGLEEDPLSTSAPIIGSPTPLTDGVWCWPETLIYFLREYHLRLPSAFTTHMEQMDWTCPQVVDVDSIDLGLPAFKWGD